MLSNLINPTRRPFAIVVTHAGAQDRLPDYSWLERAHPLDDSDWIVLADEAWAALAGGDAALWDEFERKLLISSYINAPSLIAVVGHCPDRCDGERLAAAEDAVERILRRVRSLGLPGEALGFRTGADGEFGVLVEPGYGFEPIEEEGVVL